MGTDRARALARIVDRCRKRTRWGSADYPVCESRRCRAKRYLRASPPSRAPSMVLLCASEIDIAAFPVRSSKGDSDGR